MINTTSVTYSKVLSYTLFAIVELLLHIYNYMESHCLVSCYFSFRTTAYEKYPIITTNKSILLYTSVYSHINVAQWRLHLRMVTPIISTPHNTNSQSRFSKIPSPKTSTLTMTIIKKVSYTIKRCSLLHFNSIYNTSSPI